MSMNAAPSAPLNRFCRICWKVLKVATAIVVVIVALGTLVIALEFPDARRFKRYCEYPNKDALLAAEAQNVVSSTDCVLDGTNVTIVDVGWLGFLPSGAAMLVYDAEGKLIDRTCDEGDDGRFQRKWKKAWHIARCEETRRWLCETRLPEIFLYAPATMAEFATFIEQASKDYDRPDKPKVRRGLRFCCRDKVGEIVFPPKPKNDLPIVETLPVADMSFWDALTNACERTGCRFDVYGGTVEIRE